jgi:hypothetical protein
MAVKTTGSLWVWGRNDLGQLGDGTIMNRLEPVQGGSDSNWAGVAGSSHTMAMKSNGTLWTWGLNFHGQLGNGTYGRRLTPDQVGHHSNWATVSCGDSHTVAIKDTNMATRHGRAPNP